MPTGPPSRVDAWGSAWEAVEDVPCRPCIWLEKGYGFIRLRVNTRPLHTRGTFSAGARN
jgi:hypothetical protein